MKHFFLVSQSQASTYENVSSDLAEDHQNSWFNVAIEINENCFFLQMNYVGCL